jgi:hypothetical protein
MPVHIHISLCHHRQLGGQGHAPASTANSEGKGRRGPRSRSLTRTWALFGLAVAAALTPAKPSASARAAPFFFLFLWARGRGRAHGGPLAGRFTEERGGIPWDMAWWLIGLVVTCCCTLHSHSALCIIKHYALLVIANVAQCGPNYCCTNHKLLQIARTVHCTLHIALAYCSTCTCTCTAPLPSATSYLRVACCYVVPLPLPT